MTESPSENADLYQRVAAIIDSFRPYIQRDGGDIELVGIDDDYTVKVRLRGACVGCPAAFMTLQMGVERHLRERIPEIKAVVNVG